MSQTKKMLDETIKEIKYVISEQTKGLDLALDPTRALFGEILDYCKKRGEIESEYSKAMLRLSDKMGEKLDKISSILQAVNGTMETRYELLSLCSMLKVDARHRSDVASLFSELFTGEQTMITSKYMEAQNIKSSKCKEIFQMLGEELQHEVEETFAKRGEYSKAFAIEEKMRKSFTTIQNKHSKLKKSNPVMDEKLQKAEEAYQNAILSTDRARNSYILSHAGSRSCQERLFIQQTADIFLLCNYKFEEYGRRFVNGLLESIKVAEEMHNNARKSAESLSFSDAVESDAHISRLAPIYLEGSIKMPLVLDSRDLATSIMVSGPIKKELSELCEEMKAKVMQSLSELTDSVQTVESMKELSIIFPSGSLCVSEQVKDTPRNVSVKRSQSLAVSDTLIKYLDNCKLCMQKDTRLHYLKTLYHRLLQCLESPFINQRTRLLQTISDVRSMTAFGTSLPAHCEEFDVKIPIPVTLCVQYLHENQLLSTKGIFRLSPSPQSLASIKECITTKGVIPPQACPLAVASILKQYLRELQDFVNPHTFIPKLAEISGLQGNDFVQAVNDLFSQLPACSKNLIIFIGKFINCVANYGEDNKMDLPNLAICFGPTLFPVPNTDENSVAMQNLVNRFLKEFSAKVYHIYPEEGPLFYTEEVPVMTQDIPKAENDDHTPPSPDISDVQTLPEELSLEPDDKKSPQTCVYSVNTPEFPQTPSNTSDDELPQSPSSQLPSPPK